MPRSGHGVCTAPQEVRACHQDCTVLALSITVYCLVGLWAWTPLVFDSCFSIWRPRRGRKSVHERKCNDMMCSEQCCHAVYVAVAIATLPLSMALLLLGGLCACVSQCYLGCCHPFDPREWRDLCLSRGLSLIFSFVMGWSYINWERVCSGNLGLYRSALCPCCKNEGGVDTTCVECCWYIGLYTGIYIYIIYKCITTIIICV